MLYQLSYTPIEPERQSINRAGKGVQEVRVTRSSTGRGAEQCAYTDCFESSCPRLKDPRHVPRP